MKVSAIHTAPVVEQVSTRSKRAGAKDAPTSDVSVNVSSDARWISDIKDAANELSEIDSDEVARAERDIADGQLEQRVDWEDVLDALIMEL